MVFPRVYFKSHMLVGAPPGTSGSAYPSGWMTCENFVGYLKHFIKHSKCSITQQVLLIIDNHESHTSIEALDLCKANGVTLLTIPPHCSHEMQPLGVSIYGPLKKFYNDACTSWMHSNAAIPMTIYNIVQCFGEAYPSAFTPRNILSGFRATGIWPFNRHVFDSDRYIAADVTDRDCQLPASDMVAATGTTDGAVTVSCSSSRLCRVFLFWYQLSRHDLREFHNIFSKYNHTSSNELQRRVSNTECS